MTFDRYSAFLAHANLTHAQFELMTKDEKTLSESLHTKLGVKPSVKWGHVQPISQSVDANVNSQGDLVLRDVHAKQLIVLNQDEVRNLEQYLVKIGWRC